nr:zinc finger, RING/FYVE/PHD-type [Tanacetum cinerariifolium]
ILQDQLHLIQKPATEKSSVAKSSSSSSWEMDLPVTTSNSKGKVVSSSSLLVSGSDQNQHGVVDNRDDVNMPPL